MPLPHPASPRSPLNAPADPLLLAFSPKPPPPRPSFIVRFFSAIARATAAAFLFIPQAYSRRAATRRIAWEDARENWILKQQRETIETLKANHDRELQGVRQELLLCQEALQFQTDSNVLNREVIAWYIATFGAKTEQANAAKMLVRQPMTQRPDGMEGLFQ